MNIKIARRIFALVICAFQFVTLLTLGVSAKAPATRIFYESQAIKLALSNSPDISKQYNQITLKRMKYVEAVKAIKAKMKNLRSFRWTPLLSFKFPEKLDITKDYELNIKPLTLQAEISNLQHRLNDLNYEVTAKVSKAFVKVYILQEKIAFTDERLASAKTELARNQARLIAGNALQSDIDTMESSVKSLTEELSTLKKDFELEKQTLTDLINLDVTSGYRFSNPLKDAEITRDLLADIIEYTLDNDHTFFLAKADLSIAKLNLDSYESFMRGQFGSKVDAVQNYLNLVRQGKDVDPAAYKMKYDEMLKSFDKPWDGKFKILFITFTMEWLKGQISGTRYVEEEMDVLYTASFEYLAKLKERNQAEKDLRKQVSDEYEALIKAKNSAFSLMDTVATARDALDRLVELNKLGKAEYSEVSDKQKDYQGYQMEALEALATYNELLINFDRLTCGAVTILLTGTGLETSAGEGGISYPGESPDKAYYYIYTDISNLIFVFGVNIPDGFEPQITDFEIWYENTQIGEKTPIEEQLRHLPLDYGETSDLTVRLYNNDEYVGECLIDTKIERGELPIKSGEKPAPEPSIKILGEYKIDTSDLQGVKMSTLTITPKQGLGLKSYRLVFGESGDILTSDIMAFEQGFSYLTLLIASLEDVKLMLYDSTEALVYSASFNTDNQTIYTTEEILE